MIGEFPFTLSIAEGSGKMKRVIRGSINKNKFR